LTVLTLEADGVDGQSDGWFPLSEVARLKGISKQALSRRVARLVDTGALETRPGSRGTVLVNLAAFDKAADETTDLIRATNGGRGRQAAQGVSGGGSLETIVLAREQARRASYDADLKKLDLDERLGKILSTDDVADAMSACAEAMVRAIDQISARADDIATAVAKNGSAGARQALKDIARDLRSTLARELRTLEALGAGQHASPPTAAQGDLPLEAEVPA
jgi:hypothetical protein